MERKREYYHIIIFPESLEILHQERRQVNTIVMKHFNSILFLQTVYSYVLYLIPHAYRTIIKVLLIPPLQGMPLITSFSRSNISEGILIKNYFPFS
jgi:hypothetical protein